MAKPILPSLENLTALPVLLTRVIPPEYEDENGHMNMRYYLALFDDAGYSLIEMIGLSLDYHREHGTGGFDLEHHVHYLAEVAIGDQVTIYVRIVGRTAKRIHYLMFMLNDTQGKLAAIFECVNSFADLTVRKTAPYPPEITSQIDAILAIHQALDWEAPICGVISA